MGINKNAMIRYRALDRCFSQYTRKYFIEDLIFEVNKALEEFNGNESQIKRRQLFDDIRFMKSEQGWAIPLSTYKDGRKTYYRYYDKDFSILKAPISQNEIHQIGAAIDVLSRFAGAPQFEWVQELIPVLRDRFNYKGNSKEVISFQSNFDLKGLEYLSNLFEAIIDKQVVLIHYRDFKINHDYSFTFHPYYLKQFNNRWFCLGYNPDRDIESWTIALDRVLSIEVRNDNYRDSSTNWNDYFYDMIGVTKPEGESNKEIILEIQKELAPYIITKPLHPSQKTKWNGDKLIVEINVIPNFELESLILSYGSGVKVILPTQLKDSIINNANKTLENYK